MNIYLTIWKHLHSNHFVFSPLKMVDDIWWLNTHIQKYDPKIWKSHYFSHTCVCISSLCIAFTIRFLLFCSVKMTYITKNNAFRKSAYMHTKYTVEFLAQTNTYVPTFTHWERSRTAWILMEINIWRPFTSKFVPIVHCAHYDFLCNKVNNKR